MVFPGLEIYLDPRKAPRGWTRQVRILEAPETEHVLEWHLNGDCLGCWVMLVQKGCNIF